jgi:hypothetical protein
MVMSESHGGLQEIHGGAALGRLAFEGSGPPLPRLFLAASARPFFEREGMS